jgi:hypothetical protein
MAYKSKKRAVDCFPNVDFAVNFVCDFIDDHNNNLYTKSGGFGLDFLKYFDKLTP